LLRKVVRPDALFFASDVIAAGDIDAVREWGLSVPDALPTREARADPSR
jgi:DNA-binding LacI/PurR family transcriptional regulator